MRKWIGWIFAALLAVGLGGVAYVYFAGGSGEPSTEITTPSVPDAAGGTTAFVIDETRSEASFEIGEVLRGSPNSVAGTTSELGGQVVVDPADLSTAQISQIIVNARTFATGNGFRDRAIRGPIILNSSDDEFEFITFDPTEIAGLSGSAEVGDELSFTVTGDLTVKGTTNEEVFDATVTFVDESTIDGSASTTVLREDYGIGIPNAPGVADVSEEVTISLTFVAVAS
jgi:polyisoprenoid-binding protein YceI